MDLGLISYAFFLESENSPSALCLRDRWFIEKGFSTVQEVRHIFCPLPWNLSFLGDPADCHCVLTQATIPKKLATLNNCPSRFCKISTPLVFVYIGPASASSLPKLLSIESWCVTSQKNKFVKLWDLVPFSNRAFLKVSLPKISS